MVWLAESCAEKLSQIRKLCTCTFGQEGACICMGKGSRNVVGGHSTPFKAGVLQNKQVPTLWSAGTIRHVSKCVPFRHVLSGLTLGSKKRGYNIHTHRAVSCRAVTEQVLYIQPLVISIVFIDGKERWAVSWHYCRSEQRSMEVGFSAFNRLLYSHSDATNGVDCKQRTLVSKSYV